MNNTSAIVQLNKYPPDKYNILIPVTSIQAMSSLQRVIVNEVKLDPDADNGRDVYKDKQSGKLAVTAVGGTKLAAAANISIISSQAEQPEVCNKCIAMAKATGNAPTCGGCAHAYDTKHSVTIRVPEPSGGFRMITKTKEIDCQLEKATMTDAQYKRFLPHRASIAETKAYMRCIRAALGLKHLYTAQEIAKPFVIAHIVPNLDAPDIRQALVRTSLRDMGLLFENPSAQQEATEAPAIEDHEALDPEMEYKDTEDESLPWDAEPDQEGIICADCGKEITDTTGKNGSLWTAEAIRGYSEKRFGRCLCTDCQKAAARR